MAKTLYLMRHGQTMLNKQRRIQGWFDSPLTELGRYQARGAGAELQRRGVKFDRAICSTSERCSDTLELVFDGMELPVMPYARLWPRASLHARLARSACVQSRVIRYHVPEITMARWMVRRRTAARGVPACGQENRGANPRLFQ